MPLLELCALTQAQSAQLRAAAKAAAKAAATAAEEAATAAVAAEVDHSAQALISGEVASGVPVAEEGGEEEEGIPPPPAHMPQPQTTEVASLQQEELAVTAAAAASMGRVGGQLSRTASAASSATTDDEPLFAGVQTPAFCPQGTVAGGHRHTNCGTTSIYLLLAFVFTYLPYSRTGSTLHALLLPLLL